MGEGGRKRVGEEREKAEGGRGCGRDVGGGVGCVWRREEGEGWGRRWWW